MPCLSDNVDVFVLILDSCCRWYMLRKLSAWYARYVNLLFMSEASSLPVRPHLSTFSRFFHAVNNL